MKKTKKTILILILFLAAFAAKAQNAFTVTHYDSLVDADTVTYVLDFDALKESDFYISSHIQADSSTGSTAATAYLQFSNQTSGDYWYSAATVTIDGVQTVDYTEDTLNANRLRLYVLSTGTQKTYLRWGLHAVPRK